MRDDFVDLIMGSVRAVQQTVLRGERCGVCAQDLETNLHNYFYFLKKTAEVQELCAEKIEPEPHIIFFNPDALNEDLTQ